MTTRASANCSVGSFLNCARSQPSVTLIVNPYFAILRDVGYVRSTDDVFDEVRACSASQTVQLPEISSFLTSQYAGRPPPVTSSHTVDGDLHGQVV